MVLSAEPGPKQRKASTVDKAAKRLQLVGPTREWPEPSTADLTRRDTRPSSSAPKRRNHAARIRPRRAQQLAHCRTGNAQRRTGEVLLPGHTQRRPSVPRRKLPLKDAQANGPPRTQPDSLRPAGQLSQTFDARRRQSRMVHDYAVEHVALTGRTRGKLPVRQKPPCSRPGLLGRVLDER